MTQMSDRERLKRLTTTCGWLSSHSRLIETLGQVQRGVELAGWMRDQGHVVLVAEEGSTFAFGRTGKRTELEDASMIERLQEMHPDRREENPPASISATADQIEAWAEMVYADFGDEEHAQAARLAQALQESAEHLR